MRKYKRKYYVKKKTKAKSKDTALVKIYMIKRYDDVIYRIVDNLSKRLNIELHKNNVKKKSTHLELIGCSYDKLKEYLSTKFTDGMTFDNYTFWEIDHITPISSFDLTNESEVKVCFNYKNLQPLWLKDNRSKSNKISPHELCS